MGHFINRDGHNLFVDEDGRAWDNEGKNTEYNPDTFMPLSLDEPIVAEIIEPVMETNNAVATREELEELSYNELLELANMTRGPGASRAKAIAKILGE